MAVDVLLESAGFVVSDGSGFGRILFSGSSVGGKPPLAVEEFTTEDCAGFVVSFGAEFGGIVFSGLSELVGIGSGSGSGDSTLTLESFAPDEFALGLGSFLLMILYCYLLL